MAQKQETIDLMDDCRAEIVDLEWDKLSKEHEDKGQFLADKAFFFQIFGIQAPSIRNIVLSKAKEYALSRGVGKTDFNAQFKAYKAEWDIEKQGGKREQGGNLTKFEGQPIELKCSDWAATDAGIFRRGKEVNGDIEIIKACAHPLTITRILQNKQSGQQKVDIAYKHRGKWENTIQDKTTVLNNRDIIKLAAYGIDASTENAKDLVSYIRTLINDNESRIPLESSTGILGWTETGDFIPYSGSLVFDGDINNKAMFESLRPKGDYDLWLAHMKEIREDPIVRFVISASFASVLLHVLNRLPFVVHLQGEGSIGKSVSQMAAASVWADPSDKGYMNSMDATLSYSQRVASFLNHLPYIADDTKNAREGKGEQSTEEKIYGYASGKSRGRARPNGNSVEEKTSWQNSFITSGERLITRDNSDNGAVNRVIEIECKNTLIKDGNYTATLVMQNYGFAGRIFVDKVGKNKNNVLEIQSAMEKQLKSSYPNTDRKKISSIAIVLTADFIVSQLFFNEQSFDISKIDSIFLDKNEVSASVRAYDYICQTIAANPIRFNEDEGTNKGELWGRLHDSGKCEFIKTKLDEVLAKKGYDFRALKDDWGRREFIDKGKDKTAVRVRFKSGGSVWCIRINTAAN
jgi:uncharacterized protein (DUF927 family)